ncbi:MAG: TlpA disulfide reductase family protein [Chitinophagaceae bacterium]
MRSLLFSLLLLGAQFLAAQEPQEIITKVLQAQQSLRTLYYTCERQDTLVTGHVRTLKGAVQLSTLPGDTIFGFKFHAVPDRVNGECIYDGHNSFYIDHDKKEFTRYTTPEMLEAITGYQGGQLICEDLVRIDTGSATGFRLRSDNDFYYLVILLPDLTRYDVTKRSKEITISRTTLLPVAIRKHQETLGKVQDLYWKISSPAVNTPGTEYDFSRQRYPEDYRPAENRPNKQLLSLQGKPLPGFSLTSLAGKETASETFKGKLVLLDFWEVWCGPCVASLPKVQALYEKYRQQGLEVLGIIHQAEYLESAKGLIQKMKAGFPMFTGNSRTKALFNVNAVPLYVLADRNGTIVWISEGYSEMLEEIIRKYL